MLDRHEDRGEREDPGYKLIHVERRPLPPLLERHRDRAARSDSGVAPEEQELAGTLPLLVGVRHHCPIPVAILGPPRLLDLGSPLSS